MATITRYELDISGTSTDNRVDGEEHDLTARDIRAITPTYGPFYTESLQVYDTSTGTLLRRGIHYQCVELLQEATLLYGKEICSVILIIDRQISPRVSITYQVLGGLYTNDSTSIANLYQTVLNDNRPVFWENILAKPIEYPPTLHRHLLDDLYGFEPIVAALERVRNAIVVSDIPAYEAVIRWVENRVNLISDAELRKVIPVRKTIDYQGLLAFMTNKRLLSTYRFDCVPSLLHEGMGIVVTVSSSDTASTHTLHWEVIHDTSSDDDFMLTSGSFDVIDGTGCFNIYINTDSLTEMKESFCIGLKNAPTDEEFIAVSFTTTITNCIPVFGYITPQSLFIPADYTYNDDNVVNPVSTFLTSDKDVKKLVFGA